MSSSQYRGKNWGTLVFSDAGRQRGGGETFLFCCDVMWCQHRRYIFRFPLMVQYNFTLTWLPIVQSNSSTNLIVLIVPPNNPRTTSNWLSKHHLYLNLHWGYPCSLNNTTLSNIYHISTCAYNINTFNCLHTHGIDFILFPENSSGFCGSRQGPRLSLLAG